LRLFRGNEAEGGRVDAVALVSGVFETFAFEEVTEMTFAVGAHYLIADHAHAGIAPDFDSFGAVGIVKCWPTAAGVEFCFGGKERGATPCADVGAGAFFFETIVRSRE